MGDYVRNLDLAKASDVRFINMSQKTLVAAIAAVVNEVSYVLDALASKAFQTSTLLPIWFSLPHLTQGKTSGLEADRVLTSAEPGLLPKIQA
ncbi:MAG TPA: hypothetical protein V6D03_10155 [Candidatus Caenarcaniphilales bacterium]